MNTYVETDHDYITIGLWDATPYRAKAAPAELIAELKKSDRNYQGKHDLECIEAICRGELPKASVGPTTHIQNKIMKKLRVDTWGARLLNAHTADDSGILYYLSVGTNNTDPSETQTQLEREIFRATPLTKSATTDGKQKFILFLDFPDANPGVSTTLTEDGTKTQIVVDSVTSFNVGDAVQVNTSPAVSKTRISSINGTTVNFDSNIPLSYLPLSGQAMHLILGETGAHGNEDASITENSGDLFARSKLPIYNDSDLAYFIKHTFAGISA